MKIGPQSEFSIKFNGKIRWKNQRAFPLALAFQLDYNKRVKTGVLERVEKVPYDLI